MAVSIRLTRIGAKKSPHYRVVAIDKLKQRDSRVLEYLGHFNPADYPGSLVLKEDKLKAWINKGATPSDTVKKLMREKGLLQKS